MDLRATCSEYLCMVLAGYNRGAFKSMFAGRVMTTFDPGSNKFYRFAFQYWIAVFAALLLWSRKWAIFRAVAVEQEQLFGIFGFCVFCVIVYSAYTDFSSKERLSLKSMILRGLPILISLFFLALIVELSLKSWDYEQYEAAFRAIVDGGNPYQSTRYLYPPFFADFMVLVYRFGAWLFPLIGLNPKVDSPWIFVFYIHQSALLFSLLLAYSLSLQFARRVGMRSLQGMLFVSALFLFNVPVLRTLLYNQVNFYVLVSVLASMLALSQYPLIAGVSAALGGLIKLYPFAFGAPLLVTKKWKALLGIFLGVFVVAMLETNFFRNLLIWRQFAKFYVSFPLERESSWFRNSSPFSFLRSSFELTGLPVQAVQFVFAAVLVLILVWYALRFFQREKMYALAVLQSIHLPVDAETFRNFGHLIDFSVLSLLIAPSAWEHHYVIAIPLAIWAFALRGKDAPWLVMIGMTAIFLLPVFNIYPFSYLRMAGLILLLILVSPQKIKQV